VIKVVRNQTRQTHKQANDSRSKEPEPCAIVAFEQETDDHRRQG
jgi:hypothetical protein